MNQLKPWLLLVIVFIAGFAGGVVTTRASARHFIRHAIHDPDFMRSAVEKRIGFRLRLDNQQRTKVHDILINTQGELKLLRGDFQPGFHAIVERAQSEIDALLTPEQHQRFEQLKADNRHWWYSQ